MPICLDPSALPLNSLVKRFSQLRVIKRRDQLLGPGQSRTLDSRNIRIDNLAKCERFRYVDQSYEGCLLPVFSVSLFICSALFLTHEL